MAEDMSTPDPSTLSFEDALRALEQIVRRLESGDVPLDESIALYAQGEELRKRCADRLLAIPDDPRRRLYEAMRASAACSRSAHRLRNSSPWA